MKAQKEAGPYARPKTCVRKENESTEGVVVSLHANKIVIVSTISVVLMVARSITRVDCTWVSTSLETYIAPFFLGNGFCEWIRVVKWLFKNMVWVKMQTCFLFQKKCKDISVIRDYALYQNIRINMAWDGTK